MKDYKSLHIVIIIFTMLFVVLTSIAMIIYPGGSWIDSYSNGFDFSTNFFSDLSRRTTFLNDPNLGSSILFTISLSLIGVAVICYFIMMLLNFSNQKGLKRISIVGSVIGILNALVYESIGFTPYDQYPGTHSILIIISFCGLITLTLIYAALIFLNSNYPNLYGWIFVTFFLLCSGYLIVILTQNLAEFLTYVKLRAIYQKVVVYSGITVLIFQTIGSLRYRSAINACESQN